MIGAGTRPLWHARPTQERVLGFERRPQDGGSVRVGSVRHRAVIALRLAAAWRPTGRRLRGLVRATFTSYLAIGALVWILPNLQASGPLSILVLVLVTFVVGALLRPVLM